MHPVFRGIPSHRLRAAATRSRRDARGPASHGKGFRLSRLAGVFLLATGGLLVADAGGAAGAAVVADLPARETVESLVVYGRALPQLGQANAASEGLVGYDDLRLPPRLRAGELVEAVPGVIATQHSGTGKANQYFLRGFNLDHGTDFAVSIDGVPVNLRNHGHGHGYLDLNALIPELVATGAYSKGPYGARAGDFSSAGRVDFALHDRLTARMVDITAGPNGYLRGMAAGSADIATGVVTAAVDTTRYDGPWELSEDLEQRRLFLCHVHYGRRATTTLTLSGYDGRWTATDQIPRRAVADGSLGRLGFVDPWLGGSSAQQGFTGSVDFGDWRVSAYAMRHDFRLFSNFTYRLQDPDDGDQFEQRDGRRRYGLALSGTRALAALQRPMELRWGMDGAFDDIHKLGLYSTTQRRRTGTVRDDDVAAWSVSAFAELETPVTARLRAVLGVRADHIGFDVAAVEAANSGRGSDRLLSPKGSLAWLATDALEFYASVGRGFHSNDVRGATLSVEPGSGAPADPVPVMVRSLGTEVGLRYQPLSALHVTLSAFQLDLDSELVFAGDAGTTEPMGASRRHGTESTLFWQATERVSVNASHAITRARFRTDAGEGRRIPGAVTSVTSLGATATLPGDIAASIRLRHLGEAPLTEDNAVRAAPSLLVNAGLVYQRGPLALRLDVFNLLDSNDYDIAYFYTSRLPGEPADGVDDVHFHPLEPRTVRASAGWRW